MSDNPFFTIFIPTYNRGYCIDKAVLSCESSTFKNFEVVLIDDGSTDNTESVIQEIESKLSFPFRYVYQKNQGKHVAFNHAVSLAKGQLFLTLDSDDTLLENALEDIFSLWETIDENKREHYAGIEFRCLENGVASSTYPEPYLDCSYTERRLKCKSKGEKRSAYRLEVLKQYPFPVFQGERYCRPGLIEIRMSKKYITRFSNIVAIDAGHFEDGIGANRRKIIVNAPMAYRQYFLEEISDHAEYNSKKDMSSFYKRYCRCSINAGVGLFQQLREVPNKLKLLLVYPESLFSSIGDRRFKKSMH